MNVRWIQEQKGALAGKVVLVRSGLNVPVENGVVINDFRIRKALPTLQFLHEEGAKIIVVAHIGREQDETLKPVATELEKHLPITFVQTRDTLNITAMHNGDIVLLENMRQDPREVANDDSFALELVRDVDIFVQDAFAVCHRQHTSIVGIPKLIPSFGGLLLHDEITALTSALNPQHPALCILGGAKFSTKEPLIKKFLATYDDVFVGGALQNEILAARGFVVGKSVVEDGRVPEDILHNDALRDAIDVVAMAPDETARTVRVGAVAPDEMIVDIGEETIAAIAADIGKYKSILWNGPMGWYEKGYDAATAALAHAIADTDAYSIVGGGDTVAVIQKEHLEDKFDFVSTGGGAMLEFLLNKSLPGIDALTEN